MKKVLILLLTFLTVGVSKAKENPGLNDFGRITLNTFVSDDLNLPNDAKRLLETKLTQIATAKGMGGISANPRFIITATVNTLSKDIIPGPPMMIAQNLSLTVYIADAIDEKVYGSGTIELKGVGTNDDKAFITAFKRINPRHPELEILLKEGKEKIIAYYDSQCDFILQEADALMSREKYEESIYNLSLVPEVCKKCYVKCYEKIGEVYQKKIDSECLSILTKAKGMWLSKATSDNALLIADVISEINPNALCAPDANSLIQEIGKKLRADEKARWDFKMKQYEDKLNFEKERMRLAEEKSIRDDEMRERQSSRNFDLDKMRVDAYRKVASEYARNQPKKVTYYNFIR